MMRAIGLAARQLPLRSRPPLLLPRVAQSRASCAIAICRPLALGSEPLRRELFGAVAWQQTRTAKSKGKGKDKKGKKGKGKAAAVEDDDDADDEADGEAASVDMDAVSAKMQKLVDALLREYGAMQAGRATPTMLDTIQVKTADGSSAPLTAVAKVLAQSAQALQVSVFDAANVPAVVKAIEMSRLQLRPEAQGKTLRVPVPRPTQEMRQQMTKEVRRAAEECKVALRHVRQPAAKQAKAHPVKDTARRQEKEVQQITDRFVEQAAKAAEAKEKDVMAV